MTPLQQACCKILSELSIEQPETHGFYLLVTEREQTAKSRSGLFFSVWYLAIGLALALIAWLAVSLSLEQLGKVCGGVLGVFSALLAFYRPRFVLTQADCVSSLKTPLALVDLAYLNSLMPTVSDDHDRRLKLIAAITSYLFIYLSTYS